MTVGKVRVKRKIEKFVTVKDAAEYLKVHVDTIRRWESLGHLKCQRHPISRYRIFKTSDLIDLKQKIEG